MKSDNEILFKDMTPEQRIEWQRKTEYCIQNGSPGDEYASLQHRLSESILMLRMLQVVDASGQCDDETGELDAMVNMTMRSVLPVLRDCENGLDKAHGIINAAYMADLELPPEGESA